MTPISRRSFSRLLAASIPGVLLSQEVSPGITQEAIGSEAPQTIAGYRLSEEQRALTTKFSASQEKSLASLRERELPNGLPPTFFPTTPMGDMRSGKPGR